MSITFNDEDEAKLLGIFTILTDNWSPSDRYADYVCEFCNSRPATNLNEITHRQDCDGEYFLKKLINN